jgi:hypothetical protein
MDILLGIRWGLRRNRREKGKTRRRREAGIVGLVVGAQESCAPTRAGLAVVWMRAELASPLRDLGTEIDFGGAA